MNTRLVLCFVIINLFACRFAMAQNPPAIQWQTSFGGSGADQAYAMEQTPDGGYIVTGFSASNDGDVVGHHGTAANRDMLVLRLDSNGRVLWQRSLGGSMQDGSPCLCLAHDRGYLIAGGSSSDDGDVTDHHGAAGKSDCWIAKLDTNGKTLWTKSYGGTGDDGITRIIKTERGGYLFAGRSASNDGDVTGHHGSLTASDYWVVEIDSVGKILWQNSYGGSADDAPFALTRTDDNGYVLAGDSYSKDGDVTGNHGGSDIWVLKIDDTGKILWENSFGGPDNEDMNSVTLAKDGGYIIGGSAYSSGGDISASHLGHHDAYDIWVFKLNRNGSLAWEKSYGGTGHDYEQDVHATPDGGCLITGYSTSNDGEVSGHHGDTTQYDGWVVKIDSIGKLQWQRSIGGTKMDGATGITLTRDGGCAIACNSASSDGDLTKNRGGLDFWIVKLAPFDLIKNDVATSTNDYQEFLIYPNPARNVLHVNASVDGRRITISDVLGREILQTSSVNETIDVSKLPAGCYILSRDNEPPQLLRVLR